MKDIQETVLYLMLSLQNQLQPVTIEVLRQPLAGHDASIIYEIERLYELGLVVRSETGEYKLTDSGNSEALRIYKARAREEFNGFIKRASQSTAYLDFCAEIYGYRLPLFNMMDKVQLDFIFDSIPLSPSDTILDLGCGTGAILHHLVNRYNCTGIGIDQIDPQGPAREGRYRYIQGDLDSFSDYQVIPSVCFAVDSLYFSTDLPVLIDKLKSIPQMRMYLFYSQYIFDSESQGGKLLQADHTRLASVLSQAGLTYQTTDYSTNEQLLYQNGLNSLPRYRELFEAEGNTDLYENKLQEYSLGKDLYEQGRASRYLYRVLVN